MHYLLIRKPWNPLPTSFLHGAKLPPIVRHGVNRLDLLLTEKARDIPTACKVVVINELACSPSLQVCASGATFIGHATNRRAKPT